MKRYGCRPWRRAFLAALTALLVLVPDLALHGHSLTQPAPHGLTISSPAQPLSLSPLLTWEADFAAVAYEIEVFSFHPEGLDPATADGRAIFRSSEIYTNAVNLPLYEILPPASDAPRWWRVRSLDLAGREISPFSDLAALYTSAALPPMNAPVITPSKGQGYGSVLLYPVYSWIRPHDAASFEIALYRQDPEKYKDAAPIARFTAASAEHYDDMPRWGYGPYYWRVRGLDEAGRPRGEWSKTASFQTSPAVKWEVGVLGDSISHGGGHISYGPTVLEFSWLHYLSFPAINLSRSGDLTRDMRERFERDVLPFRPRYLLILGGTNDLRAEEFTVAGAIENMEALKALCRAHHIRPIFLTLPPINPQSIARAFDQSTDPKWQEKFAAFNVYLRQQPHIDTARAFAAYAPAGLLPEWLALDGLHQDIIGKQLIAARVNSDWEAARAAADEWYENSASP